MYFLSDFAEFARKQGSKDKQPRRPSIKRGALIGAAGYGGLSALNGARLMSSPIIREALGVKKGMGRYLVGSSAIMGAGIGALGGAAVNSIRQRMHDNRYPNKK